MSRSRTLFTTAVLVAVTLSPIVLLPELALAQCSTADQCSESTCRQRHQAVDQFCKTKKRSCTKVSANDKPKLNRYLQRNEACLGARENVARCFSTTDPGHKEAIASVERAIVTCETKINQ